MGVMSETPMSASAISASVAGRVSLHGRTRSGSPSRLDPEMHAYQPTRRATVGIEMPGSSAPIPQPAPLRVLPFHSDAFDWRRFETFCLDVVRALPDVRHAEVYGAPGGNQRGIDVVATLYDGRRRTVQCRHRKRFTKGDAEKVIEETTYDAEEHEVWVTARVGAAAAGVLDERKEWSYQSDEGVSQLVRSLPSEVARKILDHAFGRTVRRAFLGGGMIA